MSDDDKKDEPRPPLGGRTFGCSLMGYSIRAEVFYRMYDDGLPVGPPTFTLKPEGPHTLTTSIMLMPSELRPLAKMFIRAADAYEADYESFENERSKEDEETKDD